MKWENKKRKKKNLLLSFAFYLNKMERAERERENENIKYPRAFPDATASFTKQVDDIAISSFHPVEGQGGRRRRRRRKNYHQTLVLADSSRSHKHTAGFYVVDIRIYYIR